MASLIIADPKILGGKPVIRDTRVNILQGYRRQRNFWSGCRWQPNRNKQE